MEEESSYDVYDLESKEARNAHRQCQKCTSSNTYVCCDCVLMFVLGWKRRLPGVKLLICSACKITAYCVPHPSRRSYQFHSDLRSEEQRMSEG